MLLLYIFLSGKKAFDNLMYLIINPSSSNFYWTWLVVIVFQFFKSCTCININYLCWNFRLNWFPLTKFCISNSFIRRINSNILKLKIWIVSVNILWKPRQFVFKSVTRLFPVEWINNLRCQCSDSFNFMTVVALVNFAEINTVSPTLT